MNYISILKKETLHKSTSDSGEQDGQMNPQREHTVKRKDTQLAFKHKTRCSTSRIVKYEQNKITPRLSFPPINPVKKETFSDLRREGETMRKAAAYIIGGHVFWQSHWRII